MVEIKKGEYVLEEVEKFCYLDGMLARMVEHLKQSVQE